MSSASAPHEVLTGKPISFGLSCWRWERRRYRTILELARQWDVTLELRESCHGLRRDIEGVVSGRNVDRFLSEFVRTC